MDDPRWCASPILRELHAQWWRARGPHLGEATRPFSRDWEQLLEDAGILSAESRSEAEREARHFENVGLLALKTDPRRPHLVQRVQLPTVNERRLAELFRDPVPEPDASPGAADLAWQPELEFLRSTSSGISLEDWKRLDRFLAQGGRERPSVPIKERSLQLFGDEKRLDALLVAAPFRTGLLSPATFRCHLVPEPLGWRRGPVSHAPLLVLENAATWESYSRWNEKAGCFSAVVFGRGLAFVDAVASLRGIFAELGGERRILYFGDLDPAGLEIPWRTSLRAQELGLPRVEPHTWSYAQLLKAGAGSESACELTSVAEDALRWLGPGAEAARALFARGLRLAQEQVGWEWLSRAEISPD